MEKDFNYYKNLGIFNKLQLFWIELGFDGRIKDVHKYADIKFDENQMCVILNGLLEKINVDLYADPKYDSLQMSQISEGLKLGYDINKFNNPKLNYKQMMLIKDGLKLGLDVDLYNSPNYSYELMMKIFKILKSKRIKPENKLNKINLLIIES